MKLLLLGYFSTVGDIEVLEVLKGWLDERKFSYDVAAYSRQVNDAIKGAQDIKSVNPVDYTHLIIVCGPFFKQYFINNRIDLTEFNHCVIIGFNLSMIEPLDRYNPFDYILARDYNGFSRPDISFLYDAPKTPVFGLCLAPEQAEYGNKQKHSIANEMFYRLIINNNLSTIKLNTQWPISRNDTSIIGPTAFESVCSRIDIMLTTRLHGLVIALKQGIPVIAIDAIAGGGKLSSQGKATGWPFVYSIDEINEELILNSIQKCLTPEYKNIANNCAFNAKNSLINLNQELYSLLSAVSVNQKKDQFPTIPKLGNKNVEAFRWYQKLWKFVVK